MTPEGRPFWSLPKRAPTQKLFDPEDVLHQNFIASLSCLLAFRHGINIPFEKPRSLDAKQKMAEKAASVKVADFAIDAKKAKEIES